MTKLEIYIDGSCSGNPGPGGWAAICVENGKKRYRSGNTAHATNNSMELMAAIGALQGCKKPCDITFYTDSQYLVTCAAHDNKWLSKRGRANRDLWMEFIYLAEKGKHNYKFVKVAGHSGNKLNDLADKYARAECVKARHLIYENS